LAKVSVNGHIPDGTVTWIGPELAPGAIEPDDGLNCAPSGELEAVQSKFPVELGLLLRVIIQVVSRPVED
jgi:hypothetical protein